MTNLYSLGNEEKDIKISQNKIKTDITFEADEHFDLVSTYNYFVQNHNYEYNREQVRVVNELQGFGEKLEDHIALLQKYQEKWKINADSENTNAFPNNTAPSSSFWGIFSSLSKEEVEKKPNPLPAKNK